MIRGLSARHQHSTNIFLCKSLVSLTFFKEFFSFTVRKFCITVAVSGLARYLWELHHGRG